MKLVVRDAFTEQLVADARDALATYRQATGRSHPDTVLDVGAHHGTFALSMIDAGALYVLAVEACGANYAALLQNLRASALPVGVGEVEPLHAAAYDGPAVSVTLRGTGRTTNSGQYSVEFDPARYPAVEEVPTVAFRALLGALLAPWDYVKVDVEGAEWSWLRGPDDLAHALTWTRYLDLELHTLANTDYHAPRPAADPPPLVLADVDLWARQLGATVLWSPTHPTRLALVPAGSEYHPHRRV